MKIKVMTFSIFFLCFFGFTAYAQNNGEISGNVIDQETGEPMRRATVMVLGTKNGGYTDVKGEFKIKNVPEGSYTIKISFVGYLPREVTQIAIKAGETTNIGKIVLGVEKKVTEEIFVDAKRINDNEAAILAVRKNAAQVSDGISQQEISRLPDSDAGQSLKRLSGVTLVENKFVYVRGVSERYSNTILNGTSLASTETDKKSFAFDMFPSEFLENANVVKSFTPDLPGNFAGGLVELNTVDFPSTSSFSLSFKSGMNSQAALSSNRFISFQQGSLGWLGFDNSFYQHPTSMPSSPAEMSKFIFNDLRSSDPAVRQESAERWFKMGQGFNSSTLKPVLQSVPPNFGGAASFSNILNLFDNDFGIVASANYGTSYTNNSISRSILTSDGESKNFESAGLRSNYSVNLAALLNLAYKINSNNSISFKNTFNNSGENEVYQITGRKEENQILQMSMDYVQQTIYSGQLIGEHDLGFQNSLLKWRVGYSESQRNQPDLRRVRYSRNDSASPYMLDIYPSSLGNGILVGRYYSNLNDNAFSGGLDYKISLGTMNFKLGSYSEWKTRDFQVRSFTVVESKQVLRQYFDSAKGMYDANFTDPSITKLYSVNNISEIDPSVVFDSQNFNVHGLGISEDTRNIDSYKANDDLYSAYLMTDFPLELFGNKLRIITGFRFEHSLQKLSSYFPFTNPTDSSFYDSTYVDKTYNDILPALNIVYELNKTSNLRFSASQTLTRPSLREYAPFSFYDFLFQGTVVGNPTLNRSLIQNYDLRYEWFPQPGEVISVSGFYKIFDDAIEENVSLATSNLQKTFSNAPEPAYIAGLEFEFRKNLGFIDDFIKYFSMNFNLAIINSEITVLQNVKKDTRAMWGQSPYTLNMGLFYYNPESETSVNLSFNTFGKRIIGISDQVAYSFSNPHIYEMSRNLIDLSVSQKLFDIFQIKFSAQNILNEPIVWEQAGTTVSKTILGSNYSLGIDYKF